MKDKGQLPESFNDAYESLLKDYMAQTYTPNPPVKYSYDSYWKIRMTKPYENQINHTDLKHFSELYDIKLKFWEIETILKFDRMYYHYANKYKQ